MTVNDQPDESRDNAVENMEESPDEVSDLEEEQADDRSYLKRQARRKQRRMLLTYAETIVAAVICIPLLFFCFWAGTRLFFPAETEVTGLKARLAGKASDQLTRKVTITNPAERKLRLERYDEDEEKWVEEASFKTGDEKKEKVTVTFPDSWTGYTYSKWRLAMDREFGVRKYTSDPFDVICRNRGGVKTSAAAAIVYCKDNGEILYEKNINKEMPNASTTKMMTAILAFENSKMDEVVTFSRRAVITPYAYLGIHTGYKFYMGDLMRAMLIMSANECSTAICEHVGGTYEHFRDMMNERAKELGCKHTHFLTPSGLDLNGHYSTVRDIAIINAKAIEFDEYNKIMLMKKFKLRNLNQDDPWEYDIKPTNDLLEENIKGYMGGKTGTTAQAGNCLSSAYKWKGNTYIIVVFDAGDRFKATKNLIKYVKKYA